MMQGEYPALPLHWIPKRMRHQRSFGHRHAMEKNFLTGVRVDEQGRVWLDGVEIMEVYTLENLNVAPVPMHINVTRIKQGLARGIIKYEMMRCTNSQEWHDYIMKTCHCEEDHIARLKPEDLKRPAIMVSWDPNLSMTSTIDGSHRICRRWREGMTSFEMALVMYPDVQHFITFDKVPT